MAIKSAGISYFCGDKLPDSVLQYKLKADYHRFKGHHTARIFEGAADMLERLVDLPTNEEASHIAFSRNSQN